MKSIIVTILILIIAELNAFYIPGLNGPMYASCKIIWKWNHIPCSIIRNATVYTLKHRPQSLDYDMEISTLSYIFTRRFRYTYSYSDEKENK